MAKETVIDLEEVSMVPAETLAEVPDLAEVDLVPELREVHDQQNSSTAAHRTGAGHHILSHRAQSLSYNLCSNMFPHPIPYPHPPHYINNPGHR